ncbi:endonuclease NucS domain-containing protein [Alteraurantiacibacter palmitatis]|uniref:Endonuclease NucS domain-containing protein n=1 Tax=Alteraurantiacibacter palmitatis TaxID=2054628 RepID=A0ABV7E6M6_9SPHN
MKRGAFKAWLVANYSPNSAATHLSQARKVEEAYGDLDALFDAGDVEKVAAELNYSSQDAKLGKPNPSKISAGSNLYANLASYKSSLRCYARFRENEEDFVSEAAIEIAGAAIKERHEGKHFELERNLQAELRREIAQLEAGLDIADGGMERSVESGFIDILARDRDGAFVVIELKAGLARREALGQITGYMGDLMQEEPDTKVRGILVAAEFDKSCLSGVLAVPLLKLARYRFNFSFEEL